MSSKSEVNNLRPTDSSMTGFMNLQFTSATDYPAKKKGKNCTVSISIESKLYNNGTTIEKSLDPLESV